MSHSISVAANIDPSSNSLSGCARQSLRSAGEATRSSRRRGDERGNQLLQRICPVTGCRKFWFCRWYDGLIFVGVELMPFQTFASERRGQPAHS